ncbi:hypothetical protein CR194_03475 [Salipaludibacillus keqinensis]|uniref:DUF1722 domain-containing protein n=1 Tax=Salipaludibacillus keqinensis TaxID=2045207 RepID=A0A323TKV0_9BACI|nr:DUF1722 domain-containing protein [Salipaludibacillus keqinensis]PYZ94604.1 hypothetical protein CR194_03475 [Salipaludibacillus keqinensis]
MKREIEQLWAINKYEVMMKGYSFYKQIQSLLKSAHTPAHFRHIYETIHDLKMQHFHHQDVINTLEHIWGYFKSDATDKEKQHFFQYLYKCQQLTDHTYNVFPKEVQHALAFLSTLLDTYPHRYLLQSSLFLPKNKWNLINHPDSPLSVDSFYFKKEECYGERE